MGGGTCIYTEGRSYWGLSLETTSHILDGNMPDINQVFRLIKERGGMTMGDIQQPLTEGSFLRFKSLSLNIPAYTEIIKD